MTNQEMSKTLEATLNTQFKLIDIVEKVANQMEKLMAVYKFQVIQIEALQKQIELLSNEQ